MICDFVFRLYGGCIIDTEYYKWIRFCSLVIFCFYHNGSSWAILICNVVFRLYVLASEMFIVNVASTYASGCELVILFFNLSNIAVLVLTFFGNLNKLSLINNIANFEIIVINDGSNDDTNSILCQNEHFRVGSSKCGRLMIQEKYGCEVLLGLNMELGSMITTLLLEKAILNQLYIPSTKIIYL